MQWIAPLRIRRTLSNTMMEMVEEWRQRALESTNSASLISQTLCFKKSEASPTVRQSCWLHHTYGLETDIGTIMTFPCLCNLRPLNMYSNNYTIVKWQGTEQQELPVLIGALLNAHHALHLWQMSLGSYYGSPSVWRRCTPLLFARRRSSNQSRSGEPRCSLRGCCEAALKLIQAHLWQGLTTAVHDRLLGRQLLKRLGCYREGKGGGRWGGNRVESTLPVQ